MQNLGLILLVFAFVFACIASFGPAYGAYGRAHLGWLSIACWIASELVGGLARVLH